MSETDDAVREAEDRLRQQIEAYHVSGLVHAAVKLGLPEAMGDRTWSAEALGEALGLAPPRLLRFLRALATIGVCDELGGGSFALTGLGRSLAKGSPSRLREKVTIVVEQYWRPWANLAFSLETGKPSFDHVFGMNVGDWRREHEEQGRLFGTYLADQTLAQGTSILEGLAGLAEAERVADIGGGCGALLVPLLIGFPHLTGILFDKPHRIATAKPFLRGFDQFGLSERIELVPGDVFEGVPVKADLYLLRNVLQHWDDAEALTILRNVRDAMPAGARLAVIERPMPERAADDPSAVMIDLHMLVVTGGQARGLAAFAALFAAAGLKLATTTPTTSGLFLIEAFPSP